MVLTLPAKSDEPLGDRRRGVTRLMSTFRPGRLRGGHAARSMQRSGIATVLQLHLELGARQNLRPRDSWTNPPAPHGGPSELRSCRRSLPRVWVGSAMCVRRPGWFSRPRIEQD